MRFLKFSLYLISFLAIAWSAILFGGPSLIKWLIISYSDGRIIPSNISVTPNLDLQIGLVNFSFYNPDTASIALGSSRSISVDWSVLSGNPLLTVNIGPTDFEGFGGLGGIQLFTKDARNFSRKKLFFTAKLNNVQAKSLGTVDAIDIDGIFTNGFKRISDINFSLSKVRYDDLISVSSDLLYGRLSQIDLDRWISSQSMSGEIFAEKTATKNFTAEAAMSQATFKTTNGRTDFKLNLNTINFRSIDGSIDKAVINGAFQGGKFVDQARIEVKQASFFEENLRFEEVFADVMTFSKTNYKATVTGLVGQQEIYISENYMGKLPQSSFKIDFKLNETSVLAASASEINLMGLGLLEFTGSGGFAAKFDDLSELYNCSNFKCQLSDLAIDYMISINGERINMNSSCSKNPCMLSEMSHVISTSNTGKIFNLLANVGLINPLILSYLYSVMISGEPFENGHLIRI